MSHKHHIIPKHMGGTNDPSNLIELSVADHADAHRKLYEQLGHWQDYVAWQGLAQLSPKEDLVRRVQVEGGKRCRQLHPNPFTGIRIGGNFASNETHRKHAIALANSDLARQKRRETFVKTKHQQGENNSQFGKVWCVLEDAINLSGRKKYDEEQIPQGWISTQIWRDRRKNKKNNIYGRHWYNNGIDNLFLLPDDAKIAELSLQRGRLIK